MGRQARLKKERRSLREERTREKLLRAAEGQRRGCLICRRSDGGFLSEEHALSESMGNTEFILPNGVVCDRCNGGVLSDLDQTLCEFFPLKMRRTMLGIESKAGKVPHTKFATGSLRHDGLTSDGQDALFLEVHSGKDTKTFFEKGHVGDRVEMDFNMTGGRRITPRYCSEISRALLKTGLESLWCDEGEAAFETRFEHVREAILGEPRDGFLAVARKGNPNHTGTEMYGIPGVDPEGRYMLGVVGVYYGMALGTNSRLAEPPEPLSDEDALVVLFTKDDLRGA
jgi:hypothetical protein